jgi:hypothetical protein
MSSGYQSPFEQPQQARRSSGMSWVLSLALILLGFLTLGGVVCVAGVYYVVSNVDKWLVSLGREAIVAVINESELPEAEKKEVIEQVDRVAAAYKEKKINQEDLERFMTDLQESPAMSVLTLYGIEEVYLQESELPEAEIAAGRRTFQRVIRGMLEGKISEDTLYAALPQEEQMLRVEEDNGNGKLKQEDITEVGFAPGDEVNTDDLREMLTKLKVAADNAQIPDEDYQPDIGDEVKKLVDRLLEGK